jgi:hypothetical protein
MLSNIASDSKFSQENPFQIYLPQNEPEITHNDLYFELINLLSLLKNQEQIEINSKNVNIFKFLGEILDNPSLIRACRFGLQNHSSFFKLTCKRFLEIPSATLSELNDFEIKICNEVIYCNSIFACCLSNIICELMCFGMILDSIEFNESHLSELLIAFFGFIQGFSFSQLKFPSQLIQDCFNLVGFDFLIIQPLKQFSIDKCFQYLFQPFCSKYEIIVQKSINTIAKHFSEISFELFSQLDQKFQQAILSSQFLMIESESTLFNFISISQQFDFLKKFLFYPALEIQQLHSLISGLNIDEIDIDLFHRFQELIFLQETQIPKTRWINTKQQFLSIPVLINQKKRIINDHQIRMSQIQTQYNKMINQINQKIQNTNLQFEQTISQKKRQILETQIQNQRAIKEKETQINRVFVKMERHINEATEQINQIKKENQRIIQKKRRKSR